MKTFILFLVVLELNTILKAFATKCAENNCTLIEEKYVCKNRNLSYIPMEATDAELLDLTGSFIRRLDANEFIQFNNLKTLILSNVSLKVIHCSAFKNKKMLKVVDLSTNLLKFLHPETFSDTEIYELNLTGNLFKRLVSNQFLTPHLLKLNLSSNFLEVIPNTTFSNASALVDLDLSDNKLRTLQINIFTSCQNLTTVKLHKNSWICDCEFYNLSHSPNIYNGSELRCEIWDREYRFANDTEFFKQGCGGYWKRGIIDADLKIVEKSGRDENVPDLILNIYGYVLFGITVLILLCCCCERQKVNSHSVITSRGLQYTSPVIDKYYTEEIEQEKMQQVHTFEECGCIEIYKEDGGVDRIPVEEHGKLS